LNDEGKPTNNIQLTTNKEYAQLNKNSRFRGNFCYEIFFIALERRDLVREAAFFLITPRFAALSKAM